MPESPHGFATSSKQEPDAAQADEEGEIAPDRPTNDPEDVASAVQEQEAKEQSGLVLAYETGLVTPGA